MYILILLIIIKKVLINNIFVFSLSITTIILAKNPNLGGIPPRLIIAVKYESFLYCSIISISVFCIFDLNSNVIMMITDLQYKIKNVNVVFKLIMILSSVHLKLKIDEYAIISAMFFLFICIILPIQAVKIIIKKIKVFFLKNY